MLIYLNENSIEIKIGSRLFALREQHKEDADLLIVNGYPADTDLELVEGDHVIMIRRGEQPAAAELESLMMGFLLPLSMILSRRQFRSLKIAPWERSL